MKRQNLAIDIVELLIKSQDANGTEYDEYKDLIVLKLNEYQNTEVAENDINRKFMDSSDVFRNQENLDNSSNLNLNPFVERFQNNSFAQEQQGNQSRNNLIFSDSDEIQDENDLESHQVEIIEPKEYKSLVNDNIIDMTQIPDDVFPLSLNVPDVVEVVNESEDVTYKWTSQCYKILKSVFGLKTFRPNQLQAINHTLNGDDTFVLMPTGGGKSLCFQLPALITAGTTQGLSIVITPLLSLMMDQVNALLNKTVNVGAFWGDMSASQRSKLKSQISEIPCRLKLLYITPEMLNKSTWMQNQMQSLNNNKSLARFIVDEAHCLSSWGHDFRPDYKALGFMRQRFPNVPIMALTATANSKVRQDVISILRMRNAKMIKQSFNRSNLVYSVFQRDASFIDNVVSFVKMKYPNESGIIYCQTRSKCEQVAAKLQSELSISCYHAGLQKEDRLSIQQQWSSGIIKVIVATIAFGMGIDKPNVRFVIHQALPSSVEGYYQETGRAGRDGLQSDCLLYYSYADTKTAELLINRGEGSREQKQRQYDNLRQMISYCDNKIECRRSIILHYFGEKFDPADCNGTCDNCNNKTKYVATDVTEIAKDCLNIVDQITSNGKYTLIYCADLVRGSRSKKVQDLGHDAIKGHGGGKSLNKSDVMRLMNELVTKGYLKEKTEMGKAGFACKYIHVTTLGVRVIDGGKFKMELNIAPIVSTTKPLQAPKRKSSTASKSKKQKNFNWKVALTDLRTRLSTNYANENDIISNKEISEVVRRKPTNMNEIKQLSFMDVNRLTIGLHEEILNILQQNQTA
eukprot:NODE_6_length_48303_cov_0.387022.p5 type:complete len:800 gc:universal NODE_6_length_48303_cov_0.387022:40846-43245(+)